MVYIHSKPTVLIVDDGPENIQVLLDELKDDFSILAANNGKEALTLANGEKKPDLILLDIMMPEMDGYEVCIELMSDENTRDIPVIFTTAVSEEQNEEKAFALGAVDYITKPFNPALVTARIRNHIDLKAYRVHLEELVAERTKELQLTQEVTIESMGTLAEYRHPETGGHIKRTKNYVRLLALKLKNNPKYTKYLTDETIRLLYRSAPLHDIGKVGIVDNILLKPGKLTCDEYDKMKMHAIYGRDAILVNEKKLGDNSFLRIAREIAYTHQEKWDGSGYPRGLKEEEIPVSGRLMAIVDVYDALISKRVYKPPLPHSEACKVIADGKGTHFDPDMVDTFVENHEEFRKIALEFADFDEERELLSK